MGLKATLLDGSYHPVDSSEMAFKMATILAFKQGFMEANPVLLEPIASLKVTVPDKFTGDVMGDLNRRRGRVLGMNSNHNGKQVIEDVTYLNTEHLGSKETDRRAVFDVYCENEKGEKILIEMQRGEQQFFKDRSIYYATYPIREQAIKGEIWDYELKAVYVIGILNFALDDVSSSSFRHEVKLMDTTTHEVFLTN